MSTSRSQSPGWLGKSGFDAVSCGPFSYIILVSRPTRFLYILYVSVDANFKLKGKERNLKDIELMPGWGAYVPEVGFKDHITKHANDPQVSVVVILHMIFLTFAQIINTCESEHDALVRANTRSSPGYAISGASLVICSRHCLIRKNGAGDLYLGEACVHSSSI